MRKSSVVTVKSQKRDKFLIPYLKRHFLFKRSGKVYSRITGVRVGKARNVNSYGGLGLRIDGKVYFINTHRAIWLVFKGLVPVGYMLNHIDEVKSNARLTNLEVVDSKDNVLHSISSRNSADQSGSLNNASKLTERRVSKARRLYSKGKATCSDLAIRCGVNRSTMHMALTRKTWKHVA